MADDKEKIIAIIQTEIGITKKKRKLKIILGVALSATVAIVVLFLLSALFNFEFSWKETVLGAAIFAVISLVAYLLKK